VGAYERVRDIAATFAVDWRTAAYMLALSMLETVYRKRGTFP
jgi:hypothetical protein